ncbi:MAG: glyoxalase III HchA [Achromobacter pulmonis]|uniref:Protein/nucleic acid deglycase 1 n=1 Tax=Achromobacter pulmonis TaxID=1389932 RepID=A0A6S7DM97_9BURK|nr:glyoxalase III HchA [Achromobacter pulmonis]MCF7770186.1 protein deglycase HchA [Achromobacter pulmonis]MPT29139.1 protein deglycase HchA [Achromobacter sp.]CAB3820132.1 Protein/nucleic acid deglycase 1 [Achromobacter pulmonis]
MSDQNVSDKRPQPDPAEKDAFFPSSYSLSQFTSPRSDLGGADYPAPYKGRKRILMIGADERYLLTDNGTFFSTGNHPVETLLPMYHLDQAGFAFDVATLSGNPVKFEYWAMPSEDQEVQRFFAKYHPQFKQPLTLSTVTAQGLDNYAAIFVPGGHGALINIPQSKDVGQALEWAAANDRFVISLCHGPAAFLAVGDSDIYRGYKICAFPDSLDAKTPDIGYMPGHLTWKFGEKLKALGFEIVNEDNISGAVHRDRKLITGDSPLAGNALGKLAAQTLLKEVTT